MNSINFKANYLKTVYVPHKISDTEFEDSELSLVELDIKDKNDMDSLADVSHSWEQISSGYSLDIYNDACKFNTYPDVARERYLAITKQNKNYDKLDADEILGLAMFAEKKATCDEICWLQVDPKNNSKARLGREYFNIGKSLVDFMKEITPKILFVQPADDARAFYEKQGFVVPDELHPSNYYYKS